MGRQIDANIRRGLLARLRFITQPLDLRNVSDINDLSAAVLAAGGRGGLLVVDTLNRAAPAADVQPQTRLKYANRNSTQRMAR
ncbi:hypothetical protein DIE17_33160 [Burkholderia sp. Bp9099]|nr:hypothetical protein DIE17_33160 [Burkholderia sp. Bp9099]